VLPKTQDTTEDTMGFGVLIIESYCFGCLRLSGIEIVAAEQRVREIDASLKQARFEADCGPKLLNGFVVFTLRKENPPKGVVCLGTLRRKLDGAREGLPGGSDVAGVQQCQSFLIFGVRSDGCFGLCRCEGHDAQA